MFNQRCCIALDGTENKYSQKTIGIQIQFTAVFGRNVYKQLILLKIELGIDIFD